MATLLAFAALSCKKDEVVPDGFNNDGASKALFTVGEGTTVHFSRGNLQYRASTDSWRFAERQYDFAGASNANASSTYADWIDLFGWGTSGWDGSGAACYHPWDTVSTDPTLYGPQGAENLVGSYANADWGRFNAIANGGGQSQKGTWRTLTVSEWYYLFFYRADASSKYGAAVVDGVKGVVVLPDTWTLPDGLAFTAGMGAADANVYTEEQWQRMESAGAIYLPSAGGRRGSTLIGVGESGSYWSSSCVGDDGADYVGFLGGLGADSLYSRYYGRSVRLVKE